MKTVIEIEFSVKDYEGLRKGEDELLLIYLSHDEAVHLAAALVEISLHQCSPELQEKFNNLVRDVQK